MRRYIEEGQYYFVTSVVKGRVQIFKDPDTSDLFLAGLQYFRYYLDFELLGYVIMPDHIHLLLRPSKRFNISKIMNLLKGNFSRRYNQIHGTGPGHVWQRKFYESVVRDEADFLNKIDYMHNNPVKAGLARIPEEFPFSSYVQFVTKTRLHIQPKIFIPEM